MLVEQHNWFLLSVDLLINGHTDHGIAVHRFTCEEHEVLELGDEFTHDCLDVLFEVVDLCFLAIFIQVLNDPLHVVLQVYCELLLASKASFLKSVVEDDVNSSLSGHLRVLSRFFGGSIGTSQLNLSLPT